MSHQQKTGIKVQDLRTKKDAKGGYSDPTGTTTTDKTITDTTTTTTATKDPYSKVTDTTTTTKTLIKPK